jgi:hypothetical protein
MEKNGFSQARHHLAAASFILDQYETDLNLQEGNDEALEAKYVILLRIPVLYCL